jgi:DNA primase
MTTTTQTAIDAIRERVDLGDLISEIVLITEDGDGCLVGACPLRHGDGDGVIIARAASGVWYCRTCGNGGDVIAFVQRTRNMSRRAAIAHLWGRLIDASTGPHG